MAHTDRNATFRRPGLAGHASSCTGPRYVNWLVRGTNWDNAPAGTNISVDTDYGRMSVVRYFE